MAAFGMRRTRIYCRAGCPTRTPLPQHSVRFPLAASAEAAGYRACHRCRPYRSPQTLDWAAPELVCRAVRLILAGALDRGNENDLGARLGVSARHLRRLFGVHLGLTPDGLARSARAHFARRLLDDTDLSVLEVAHAAGYGSVRQFNRACRQIFHEPPTALRGRRRRADRLIAEDGLRLRLPFSGPLDWPALAEYFAERAIPGVEHVEGLVYRRTVVSAGGPGALELLPGDDQHLELRAHLADWHELIHLVERARRITGMDTDHGASLEHLEADGTIGDLVAARPGLRPPGTWDPFETGVHAIAGRHAGPARANAIVGRLVEQHGTRVTGFEHFGLTHLFPPPSVLASADLSGLGLMGHAQGQAVSEFAHAVLNGAIVLDGSAGLDDLVASLGAIDGVAPWTAQYIALRLGERDACPVTDLQTRRVLGSRVPASAADLTEAWRPCRALAATHVSSIDGLRTRQATGRPHAAQM